MKTLCSIILSSVLLASCGDERRGDAVVPRREAFPRLQLPEAVYRQDSIGCLGIRLNNATKSFAEASGWLTVDYPALSARIFMTMTPDGGNGSEVVANRLERLSLNTGGAYTTADEGLTPGGREYLVTVTPSGSPTPVQFIVTAPGKWVLSGSAVVDGITEAPADSLQPVVDMLERDIYHMISEL